MKEFQIFNQELFNWTYPLVQPLMKKKLSLMKQFKLKEKTLTDNDTAQKLI